jgi:hypothetical protein
MSGEELGRNEGSETGSASGDEDSAAGAEAGKRTQDVATEGEGRRLKKQEPKPRTKSGNKPRTILKHAEKLALIAMSGADKTLTQEQIAAKFEWVFSLFLPITLVELNNWLGWTLSLLFRSVNRSTVSKILSKKHEILDSDASVIVVARPKPVKEDFHKIQLFKPTEDATNAWLDGIYADGGNVTDLQIQTKAKELHATLEGRQGWRPNFMASEKWVKNVSLISFAFLGLTCSSCWRSPCDLSLILTSSRTGGEAPDS